MDKGLAFITHSPDTYPSKQPQIDEAQLARRKRRRTSPLELSLLEAEFRKCPKPGKQEREVIAERVGMSDKAVQIWFQNKRQSCRRARESALRIDRRMSFPGSIGSTTPDSDSYSPLSSQTSLSSINSSAGSPYNIKSYTASSVGGGRRSLGSLNTNENSLGASLSGGAPLAHGPHNGPVLPRLSQFGMSFGTKVFREPSEDTDADEAQDESLKRLKSAHKSMHQPQAAGVTATINDENAPPPPVSGASVAAPSKSVRLAMSADGRAQVIVRSPLKRLDGNAVAGRGASMPVSPRETECANNLLFLRAGGTRKSG